MLWGRGLCQGGSLPWPWPLRGPLQWGKEYKFHLTHCSGPASRACSPSAPACTRDHLLHHVTLLPSASPLHQPQITGPGMGPTPGQPLWQLTWSLCLRLARHDELSSASLSWEVPPIRHKETEGSGHPGTAPSNQW